MKLKKFIHKLYVEILELLYPNKCSLCSEIIASDEDICDVCRRKIVYFDPNKRCKKCGLDKNDCMCQKYVFHFESLICSMKYIDPARHGMITYKLGARMHCSMFFARRMAMAVVNEYRDIKFDALCHVPTSFESRLKNGFDHNKMLCKELARLLDIPFVSRALRCRLFSKHQHGNSYEQRFLNVKNKYYSTMRLDGKIVLLADDVKTTGASLDECARQLLMAGAKRVYCVTALAVSGASKNRRVVEKH